MRACQAAAYERVVDSEEARAFLAQDKEENSKQQQNSSKSVLIELLSVFCGTSCLNKRSRTRRTWRYRSDAVFLAKHRADSGQGPVLNPPTCDVVQEFFCLAGAHRLGEGESMVGDKPGTWKHLHLRNVLWVSVRIIRGKGFQLTSRSVSFPPCGDCVGSDSEHACEARATGMST